MTTNETDLEPMPDLTRVRLVEAAITRRDGEICGFVLKDWEVLPVQNVAEGKSEFAMPDSALLEIYKTHGNQLLGVYHSHPSGREGPSDVDAMYAPPDLRYWIIANDQVHEWDMSHDPPIKIS